MGHDLGMLAFYGVKGGVITAELRHQGERYPMPIFPGGQDPFGNDKVAQTARAFGADITISFVDAWVLDGEQYSQCAPWCPLFPIDCWPLPPSFVANLKHAFQPIVYSRFGERMAREAGLDVRYVPHMLETEIYTPGPRDDARERIGWPKDAFVATMVATNRGFPARKALVEAITAFAYFACKHKDAVLYLHTKVGNQPDDKDINLQALITDLGIADRVMFVEPYAYFLGVPLGHLVDIYRASNVLLSPSYGEGLCMPVLEAAACGIPSIVGDWTGVSEIAFGGYKLPLPGRHVEGYGFIRQNFMLPHGGNQAIPVIGDIIEGLEWAYSHAADVQPRAASLAYAADAVAEKYWKPVLEEIEARLKEPVRIAKVQRGKVRI